MGLRAVARINRLNICNNMTGRSRECNSVDLLIAPNLIVALTFLIIMITYLKVIRLLSRRRSFITIWLPLLEGLRMLNNYLDRRASGRCRSSIVHTLTIAAAEAAARGDATAAFVFQQEIDRLRARMVERGETYISPRPEKEGQVGVFDSRMIAIQWASLPCAAMHQTSSACLIDCGDRGRVSITSRGISLTGGLQNDPAAILLAVRHGQLNWPHGFIAHGSPEEKFRIAVAAKMLGVKVKGAKIPRARRAEADALVVQWQPLLDTIREHGEPTRPSQQRGSPSVTISNPAFT